MTTNGLHIHSSAALFQQAKEHAVASLAACIVSKHQGAAKLHQRHTQHQGQGHRRCTSSCWKLPGSTTKGSTDPLLGLQHKLTAPPAIVPLTAPPPTTTSKPTATSAFKELHRSPATTTDHNCRPQQQTTTTDHSHRPQPQTTATDHSHRPQL